ncbi:MAG: hypothetical protein KAJ51_09460 [Thermoplasmata archaeon]|nr:hypothetical protein [Thermoplasmata archaeon]
MSNLEQRLYFSLTEKEQRVFTIQNITEILNISIQHARKIASNMVKKNAIERVKPGLFVRIPESIILDKQLYKEDAVLIAANEIKNAYISHYTSLSILGLAERYINKVYISTMKHQRDIIYHDIQIKFIAVIPSRFFGIRTIEYFNKEINISDQERTILDIINKPGYAGGWSEIINCLKNLEEVNWNILIKYIKKFNNKILARRIGYVMDNLENISMSKQMKREIKKFGGKNIYYFDSTKSGEFDQEWNMIIPKAIQEVLYA